MEEPVHWKQFHWKSWAALWDNWICGRLSEELKRHSSIFTFNDFDYFSTKASVMWGFASLAMKKKTISTSLEKKITSLSWAVMSIWALKLQQQWFPQQERAADISSTWSYTQNKGGSVSCHSAGKNLPWHQHEGESTKAVSDYLLKWSSRSCAAPLGSISSLLVGRAAGILLHESTNMFLFQYSWRQDGKIGIKSCLSACRFNESAI